MNTALNIAIWVSVVVCVIGIVIVSCWLLLDWQREVRRARAAARMAQDYCGDAVAEVVGLVEATEYTWPIVAQQPPVFYEKAVTVPIARSLVVVVLPMQRVEGEESPDFQWPVVDVDRLAGSKGSAGGSGTVGVLRRGDDRGSAVRD